MAPAKASVFSSPDDDDPLNPNRDTSQLGPTFGPLSGAPPNVNAAPDTDQPPALKPIGMASPTMPVFSNPEQPEVRARPTPIQEQIGVTTDRLKKLQHQDADPWGSDDNHPGFWGKTAHVFSTIGNVAGDILAPAQMAMIPGTQLNRQVQEKGLGERLQSLTQSQSENEQRQALTSKAQVETAGAPTQQADDHSRSAALTREANDKAEQLENPVAEYEYQQTDHGLLRINKATGEAQPVTLNGAPIGPKAQTKVVSLEEGGKPHQVMVDDATGKPIADLGESGEKPPSVRVSNANPEAALDREVKQYGAGHQKSYDSANSQLEKIDDARADINGNASAQAVGIPKVLTALVSGAGTGVRITQAELNQIAKARGWSGDFEGGLNAMSGKGVLTAQQQKQLSGILDDAKARIIEKQNIAKSTLDSMSTAASREQIIQADKQARENLTNLERYGKYVGQEVKLKNGQTVTVQHVHPDGTFD